MQTLTKLDLVENELGVEGARHLSGALQVNKVRKHSLDFHDTNVSISLQTRATLVLSWNKIGDEGARHLSGALQVNKVRKEFS